MRVKGDDVGDAHILEFLKTHGTVQALTGGTAVLTAFVEHRHDHCDAFCLTAHGGNDPLQVGKMLIRTHGDRLPEHPVFDIVCAGVAENIHIITADTLLDHALGFPVSETGTGDIDQEVLPLGTGSGAHIAGHGFLGMILPFFQPAVDFHTHLFGSRHGDEPQGADGIGQKRILVPCADKICHDEPPSNGRERYGRDYYTLKKTE